MSNATVSVIDPALAGRLYAKAIDGSLATLDVEAGWTVMAVIRSDDEPTTVVLEDHTRDDGPLVYVRPEGVELVLPKTLEPTKEPPAATLYNGHAKVEVLGEVDLLRQEVLASGQEPTYEQIAAMIPPLRKAKAEGSSHRMNPHTFVGTPQTIDAIPIFYGKEYGARLNPLAISTELWASVEGDFVEQGIVGGWLPTVRTVHPVDDHLRWDSLVFAGVHTENIHQQPAFVRYLRLVDDKVQKASYYDKYLPYPFESNLDDAEFYRQLRDLHAFWAETLPVQMQIDVPLNWLQDFVRHAFALEAITRVNEFPRYGTVTKDYGGGEHDGFQDVFTQGVGSTIEWGLFARARSYIDNYLNHYVRDNGALDYRGPEIPQYGRMLTVIAQYAQYTGDYSVLQDHDRKIRAILRILESRLERARALPDDDPSHGLIRGRQEADSSFVTQDLAVNSYDQPYWNNSAEAWRAFVELSRAWRQLSERTGDETLAAAAAHLLATAAELKDDLDSALPLSILTDRDLPYLPMYAGSDLYHIDYPYRATPQSFDDNRVWTEFMGSGVIPNEIVDLIMDYEAKHWGCWLGIIGNRKHIVVFLAHGQGYAFIQNDRIDEFLMLYYGLIAHGYTRGTWSAFECVDLDRDRAEHTPYAGPAQLVVAPLTKWMLVFDDVKDDRLWLAKATPREWLENGRRIAVTDAPTRFGTVTFELESHIDDGYVAGAVTLVPNPAGTPSEFLLKLRLPNGAAITAVEIDGMPSDAFDTGSESVLLPAGAGSRSLRIHVA